MRRPWSIVQSEWHANERGDTIMRCKIVFVSIFLGYLEFPKLAVTFPRQKCRRVSQRVNTLLHLLYWVQLHDWHCVPPDAVYRKEQSSVLLIEKESWWGPRRLDGLSNVPAEHLISSLVYQFSRFRLCVVQYYKNCPAVHVSNLDSVLHALKRAKVSLPHWVEFWKHISKRFAKCGMLVE